MYWSSIVALSAAAVLASPCAIIATLFNLTISHQILQTILSLNAVMKIENIWVAMGSFF